MNDSGSLAAFVQRWWAVLLCGAVVAAAVGYITATQLTETFEAETQLLVGPVNTTFDLDASGTLARTYAELATTRPVLARAISAAGGGTTAKDLEEVTTIESNEVTRVIAIRVQDNDRGRSAALANEIAARLVEITADREGGATSGLERFGREPEIVALPEEDRAPILGAADRVFGPAAGRLSITEPATPPEDPIKPSIPLIVLLAAIAGGLLASAVALSMESRGMTVPRPAELRELIARAAMACRHRGPRSIRGSTCPPLPDPAEDQEEGVEGDDPRRARA